MGKISPSQCKAEGESRRSATWTLLTQIRGDTDVLALCKLTVRSTRLCVAKCPAMMAQISEFCWSTARWNIQNVKLCETYTYDLSILIMQCWFGCSCEEHFDDHDANGGDGDEIMVRPGWLERGHTKSCHHDLSLLSNGVCVSLSFFKSSRLWGCLGFWRDTFRIFHEECCRNRCQAAAEKLCNLLVPWPQNEKVSKSFAKACPNLN